MDANSITKTFMYGDYVAFLTEEPSVDWDGDARMVKEISVYRLQPVKFDALQTWEAYELTKVLTQAHEFHGMKDITKEVMEGAKSAVPTSPPVPNWLKRPTSAS